MLTADLNTSPNTLSLLELATARFCNVTATRIPATGHAVVGIDPENHASELVVDVDAVDRLIHDLEAASFTAREEIGPAGILETFPPDSFSEVNGHCLVCADPVDRGEAWLGHTPQSSRLDVGHAHVHAACTDEFTDILDRVWEHAPTLLSSRI